MFFDLNCEDNFFAERKTLPTKKTIFWINELKGLIRKGNIYYTYRRYAFS